MTSVSPPHQSLADNKSIIFSNKIHHDLILTADEFTLCNAIGNLLNNAIKFTPESGTIEVSTKLAQGEVTILIKDNGVGMDKQTIDNLFQVDKMVSTPGTNMEPGSGLGLLLVKEFVSLNNGTISIESEPGKGSEFTISLKQQRQA